MRANSAACCFDLGAAVRHPVAADQTIGELQEGLLEYGLAAIAVSTDGSKFNSGETSATTRGEIPCATASRLNCATQRSKLSLLWQLVVTATAGLARTAVNNASRHDQCRLSHRLVPPVSRLRLANVPETEFGVKADRSKR